MTCSAQEPAVLTFTPTPLTAGAVKGSPAGMLSIDGAPSGGAWSGLPGYSGSGCFQVLADGSVEVWVRPPAAKSYPHLRAAYTVGAQTYEIEFTATAAAAAVLAGGVLSNARVVGQAPAVMEYASPWTTPVARVTVDNSNVGRQVRARLDSTVHDGALMKFALQRDTAYADGAWLLVPNGDFVRDAKASYAVRILFDYVDGNAPVHLDLTIPVAPYTVAAYMGARYQDGVLFETAAAVLDAAGKATSVTTLKGVTFTPDTVTGPALVDDGHGKRCARFSGAEILGAADAGLRALIGTDKAGFEEFTVFFALKGAAASGYQNVVVWDSPAAGGSPCVLAIKDGAAHLIGAGEIALSGAHDTAGGHSYVFSERHTDLPYADGSTGHRSRPGMTAWIDAGYADPAQLAPPSYGLPTERVRLGGARWGGNLIGDLYEVHWIQGYVGRDEIEMFARSVAAKRPALMAQPQVRARWDETQWATDYAWPFDASAELTGLSPTLPINQSNISGSSQGANPELCFYIDPSYAPAQEWTSVMEVRDGALWLYGDEACPELQAVIALDADPAGPNPLTMFPGSAYSWVSGTVKSEGYKTTDFSQGGGLDTIYQAGVEDYYDGIWPCPWLWTSNNDQSEQDSNESRFGRPGPMTLVASTRHNLPAGLGSVEHSITVPDYSIDRGIALRTTITCAKLADGSYLQRWYINGIALKEYVPTANELASWYMILSQAVGRWSGYSGAPDPTRNTILATAFHDARLLKPAPLAPPPSSYKQLFTPILNMPGGDGVAMGNDLYGAEIGVINYDCIPIAGAGDLIQAAFTTSALNDGDASEQGWGGPVTFAVAYEYPAGSGVLIPALWDGAPSITIANHTVTPLHDPLAIPGLAQASAGELLGVQCKATGSSYEMRYQTKRATGAGRKLIWARGAGPDLMTTDRSTWTASGDLLSPAIILAEMTVRQPAEVYVGDSITVDITHTADALGVSGFAREADADRGVLKLAAEGNSLAHQLGNNFTNRLALIAMIPNARLNVHVNLGENDLGDPDHAPRIAANLTSLIAQIKDAAAGECFVYPMTLSPNTASGASLDEANREAANAAIRAGLTGAAACYDWADWAETARDSGVWGRLTGGNEKSSDKVHPNWIDPDVTADILASRRAWRTSQAI